MAKPSADNVPAMNGDNDWSLLKNITYIAIMQHTGSFILLD